MPRQSSATGGPRCVRHGRECVWSGAKTLAEHERVVNGLLAKIAKASGTEIAPYTYDPSHEGCRQATEKDRSEGVGIFGVAVEREPLDPAVSALVERLRNEEPEPRPTHRHTVMTYVAATGVRSWDDGCVIESKPPEVVAPSLRAVEGQGGTPDPSDAATPSKRRRKRTRASLTVVHYI